MRLPSSAVETKKQTNDDEYINHHGEDAALRSPSAPYR
jgi:hypothetical protein